mmetsp:Transcript_23762/g.63673  ORF Transcript_23762/g.63673 Transcript_23762/m.63673 type:complete len:267 (-) Transcript_23762:112-912(-)
MLPRPLVRAAERLLPVAARTMLGTRVPLARVRVAIGVHEIAPPVALAIGPHAFVDATIRIGHHAHPVLLAVHPRAHVHRAGREPHSALAFPQPARAEAAHVDVAVRGESRAKAKPVGNLSVEGGLDGGVTLGAATLVDAYCDDALEQVLVRIGTKKLVAGRLLPLRVLNLNVGKLCVLGRLLHRLLLLDLLDELPRLELRLRDVERGVVPEQHFGAVILTLLDRSSERRLSIGVEDAELLVRGRGAELGEQHRIRPAKSLPDLGFF